MDIGPVSAIRPVAPVNPRRETDLGGVFEVELRHQQQNEADSPARRASRGLEDEEDELLDEDAGAGIGTPSTIHLIA